MARIHVFLRVFNRAAQLAKSSSLICSHALMFIDGRGRHDDNPGPMNLNFWVVNHGGQVVAVRFNRHMMARWIIGKARIIGAKPDDLYILGYFNSTEFHIHQARTPASSYQQLDLRLFRRRHKFWEHYARVSSVVATSESWLTHRNHRLSQLYQSNRIASRESPINHIQPPFECCHMILVNTMHT